MKRICISFITKGYAAIFLAIIYILTMICCNNRNMNYIIENEPSVAGIVEQVYDNSILIYCEQMDGYLSEVRCSVSLDVENQDSMTHFNVGDEVVVYFNGDVAESDPLQISTVYAITLKTPANRSENNKP